MPPWGPEGLVEDCSEVVDIIYFTTQVEKHFKECSHDTPSYLYGIESLGEANLSSRSWTHNARGGACTFDEEFKRSELAGLAAGISL